jgi:DnaA family protein
MDSPPARVALRDDLRTRLGWGLTFELRALADADKPAALLAHARQLGITLGDDVIAYLLAHGRRDMRTLLSTLAALDRHSLSTHRAITVPLLRDWMARNAPAPASGSG